MDKDIKTQWVGALRSGEYTQGIGHLKSKGGREPSHCCLGVLCELYDKAMGDDAWEYGARLSGGDVLYAHKGEKNYPSGEVMDWARLWDVVPDGGDNTVSIGHDNLASLNDGGKSFEEIANIIESSL